MNDTQHRCNAIRLKEQAICDFFVQSSTHAISVLNKSSEDAQGEVDKCATEIASITPYLQYVVLPLI